MVIHHMPGYDEGMKEITCKVAAHGYLALCPNLYSRRRPGASADDAAAVACGSEECRTIGSSATCNGATAI